MGIFRDLMWFFRMEKKSYGIGVIFLVLVSAINLLPPYIVGVIVDSIQTKSLTPEILLKWALFIFAIAWLAYWFRYIWRVLIFGSALRLGRLLRNRLYEHFTKMSPRFYHKRRIGDMMAHSTNDVQAVETTAGEGILTLVDSITMGGLVAVMMAVIDWRLTLIVLLPMPFMAWATSYFGTLLHRHFHHAQAAFSDLNDKVQENVSGVRVIKAFGQEEAEKRSFGDLSADVVRKNIAVAKIDSLFDPTISLIVGISFMLAVGFGAVFVVRGQMSLGELTTFTIYLGQLIWPMLAFGLLFNIVERGRASYDRISSLLAKKPDIADREGASAEVPAGDVIYHISSYSYPEQQIAALRDIRFSLPEGRTLGIVGRTGSGKTTLLRLLLREFDLGSENGDIMIGGTSIYDVKLEALRAAIGYVPQDHFLFSATIAENIAFGKPDASLEEIQAAARAACIHDDIVQFPDGYGTMVGERGVTLSGGQKQRISIARAFLANPHILMLDDALSAVDAKTESGILQELEQNRRNKTTLISAHRLSAIEHADLIVVLERGEIAERGTHAQLMEARGKYYDMYMRQQLESSVAEGGA
ncbi:MULTISPECIES: ABC transporter transmembrane domain-containing protein [unclassified Paenibacillus]|uniref:ABC transporter transmembrane domain-containing protein n=1 Tax=unclassified Paenibacillus TaxID=185978 RepID=UPI001C1012FB|nr:MULTISPECIES: ABC transporter transmembrane domain-containing protein [unclassified Paenibacillus]MBU5442363.1 ATP-binding cassette domain-containing protein [Paenibacillus sp. MSJ-34]CAH0121625.1 putative multidrug resistance ABC transporter ATP-binding/permease protein YheI [Paenibacillus sp. CECT 9249]